MGGGGLWKRISTKKYNMSTTPEEILRLEETLKGLIIWNLANQNKDVVSKHAFWEIRNGNSAKFWEETWQQTEKLNDVQALRDTCQKEREEGLNYVIGFWNEDRQEES